jgi:hypothetical protein
VNSGLSNASRRVQWKPVCSNEFEDMMLAYDTFGDAASTSALKVILQGSELE